MSERKKFKDLSVGDAFVFAAEVDHPFSGIAKGPWIKTSARKYRLQSDTGAMARFHEHMVGSIGADVIRAEDEFQRHRRMRTNATKPRGSSPRFHKPTRGKR